MIMTACPTCRELCETAPLLRDCEALPHLQAYDSDGLPFIVKTRTRLGNRYMLSRFYHSEMVLLVNNDTASVPEYSV